MTSKEKGDRPINSCSDRLKAHTKLSPSHCISSQSRSLYKAHLKDLKASGLTDENIAGIQHFSADVETARTIVGHELSGLIFSYFDPCGIPYHCVDGTPFYRIKPDWGDRKTEDSPKYLSPKDQGCRPYFSCLYSDWPKAIKSTKIDLWETEGEKKGDCGCANGLAAIAFAGVDAWVDSCDRITGDRLPESRVLPELDAIEWKHRKVYQCFDSDIIEKIPVQTALAKRAYYLRQLGAYPYLVLLPNEINGAKNGLDDFVFRHGIEALRILGKEAKPTPLELPKTKQGKDAGAVLKLEEPNEQYKSLMAWAVLKEDWAYRAGIGW
jgi:putative DNA primase/helicase